jgi:flavin reductase (DIM6/NTAB) family NADH-FMN oxidoreductase RutF
MTSNSSSIDQSDATLRLLDRELWVVTASNSHLRSGLLATWVSVASIHRERPVLVAGLAPNHFTTELVQASRSFAAHLLRPDQVDLAWNFARDSGRDRDKFTGLEVQTHGTGSPILTDCPAWFDCRAFARHDTGDRLYFWADIVASDRSDEPICLCEHEFFRSLTPDQRQTLLAARNADAAKNRPLHEKWRQENPW